MAIPHKIRYNLGQLMVFIAFTAVFLTASIASCKGFYTYWTVIYAVIGCCGIGVFFYNVRLSRWMWLVILGYALQWLADFTRNLAVSFLPSPPSNIQRTFQFIMQGIGSLLFVIGFALTFREIRRRLAISGNAP